MQDIGRGGLGETTTLDMNGSKFNGTIPASLTGLWSLQYLDVSGNRFTGTIPALLSGLRNLQLLGLNDNLFTGTIPADLGELASLHMLYLANNQFDAGQLPSSFKNLTNLVSLWASQCNLVGEFPNFLWSLKELQLSNLYTNNLTGNLVVDGLVARNLTVIDVSENKITGVIPSIPASIGRLPSLTRLRLHTNMLNGTLPPELGKQSPGLNYVEVDYNELTAEIPEGLCTGDNLQHLTAKSNQLNGSIPAGLANCATLGTLSLDNNQLSGDALPATVHLNLSTILIGNNQFGGNIPAALAALHVFTAENNRFSGAIPASLGDGMPLLQRLNLSGNQLSDGIPRSVAKLSQLTEMDLSRNQLTGGIPVELGAMPVLSVLNLSSNKLSGNTGQVPAGFATAVYDTSFLNNPGLCTAAWGPGYLTGVRSCAGGSQDGGSSGGKRRRVAEQDNWKITPFVKDLGFGEAPILRGLTEENLVGRGGSGRVYRVAYTNRLNGRAGAVAVKQIRTAGKLDQKLEREFASEAGIIGNLRHNNIVKLLCCRSSAESKLLVWLHGDALVAGGRPMARARSARREPLDWPARLRVAVDAAQGLCYMHHEYEPPIVHRDVKTSNILLDSEFRAKIADFGLATGCCCRPGRRKRCPPSLARSATWLLCAYTKKVNEKVDSFGVILLELTTGKEANNGGEHGCLADWARRHYQSGGSIADATDKSIRYDGYSDEIQVVFRLGVLCTADMPSEQTYHKGKTERGLLYEVALLPKRGIRRKQLSNGSGIDIEEKMTALSEERN
uniref:Protein kinase domain-containing protein n=1 Tax=Setaria italica TaxID=4555 RepID=K3XR42_SETIT